MHPKMGNPNAFHLLVLYIVEHPIGHNDHISFFQWLKRGCWKILETVKFGIELGKQKVSVHHKVTKFQNLSYMLVQILV